IIEPKRPDHSAGQNWPNQFTINVREHHKSSGVRFKITSVFQTKAGTERNRQSTMECHGNLIISGTASTHRAFLVVLLAIEVILPISLCLKWAYQEYKFDDDVFEVDNNQLPVEFINEDHIVLLLLLGIVRALFATIFWISIL
uniref:Uncharacterized protein n=1 Tax=Anopheles dirus TaxID=7168 RepID=A0A182NKK8_9DIPT